jgi:two-component system sensor histidine kinase VicK
MRLLSFSGFFIALISRLFGFFYLDKITDFPAYAEFSLCNLVMIIGNFLFYLTSFYNFKSLEIKRLLTLIFAAFLLLSTLYVSYVNSMHNTKNTLTMVLVGVFLTGIFLTLEKKQIFIMALLLFFSFWLSIVNGKISFLEKLLNACAGFTLAAVLLFISRYSYYFKSMQFCRLKELEEKKLEIELLSAQKNDVLGYVMHDLRAPLGYIKTLNSFVQDQYPDLKEARLIDKASSQAQGIINDLLDALKGNVGEITKQEIELTSFVKSVVVKWCNVTARKIEFKTAESVLLVELNAAKMERVLDNLLQNAIKFSPPAQPILVDVKRDGSFVKIHIRDFGIGVPAVMQVNIFNQFTEYGRKGLQGENSIGIGLHISRKIVEKHQGTLLVESKEGEGSLFTIALPLMA